MKFLQAFLATLLSLIPIILLVGLAIAVFY
jgi:hypothetical protein